MEPQRLNKLISHNTKYSRREADELIKNGHIRVRGKNVTDLSTKATLDDKVEIRGKRLYKRDNYTVIAYHKPKGELVAKKDDRGRKTIYHTLSRRYKHFISVGRLDYASTGLLLLTDAPDIATALMAGDLERVYYVRIKGDVNEVMKDAMVSGLHVSDARAGGHSHSKIVSMEFKPFLGWEIVKKAGEYTTLKVAINEGKNRELRRFFAHFDTPVVDLKRVSYGIVDLGVLKVGKSRYFTQREYEALRDYLTYYKKNKSKGQTNKKQ